MATLTLRAFRSVWETHSVGKHDSTERKRASLEFRYSLSPGLRAATKIAVTYLSKRGKRRKYVKRSYSEASIGGRRKVVSYHKTAPQKECSDEGSQKEGEGCSTLPKS